MGRVGWKGIWQSPVSSVESVLLCTHAAKQLTELLYIYYLHFNDMIKREFAERAKPLTSPSAHGVDILLGD